MARAKYKCSKCSRSFGMPAHLARHMNTIHAGGRTAKAKIAARTKGKRGVGRPLGSKTRVSAFSSAQGGRTGVVSSDAGARLLIDMESFHNDLLARRNSLEGEIDGLARAMEALGSPGRATAPRKQARTAASGSSGGSEFREGSLKSFIVRVLRQNSKPLSPNDIGTRVVNAGFRTKAKDITKAVSNTLPQLGGVKRVGFGMYQLGRK